MILYTTNILAAPLMIVVWAIDIYVFLVALRLVLGRLSSDWAGRVCLSLQPFTDGLPRALAQRLATWRRRPVPKWSPWLCVIGSALIARHCLLWVVLAMS